MVSSKDSKDVGNREHHTHSWICVAFHLQLAAEKEWRVFIYFPIRLGKKLLDSGVCTLADSELIPLITQPVAMSSNCTKFIHILMTSNILETFDLSFTCFSHINREVDFIYQVTAIKLCIENIKQFFSLVATANFFPKVEFQLKNS